jgi:hypothetical protein
LRGLLGLAELGHIIVQLWLSLGIPTIHCVVKILL